MMGAFQTPGYNPAQDTWINLDSPPSIISNPLANDQMSQFFAPGQLTINFPGSGAVPQSKVSTWLFVGLLAIGVLLVVK